MELKPNFVVSHSTTLNPQTPQTLTQPITCDSDSTMIVVFRHVPSSSCGIHHSSTWLWRSTRTLSVCNMCSFKYILIYFLHIITRWFYKTQLIQFSGLRLPTGWTDLLFFFVVFIRDCQCGSRSRGCWLSVGSLYRPPWWSRAQPSGKKNRLLCLGTPA